MSGVAKDVAQTFEDMALTSIVGGFSFASAVAWMDLVRFINSRLIKVEKNGGQYYLMTALATTLMGVLVYMVLKSLRPKKVTKPQKPVYAVTG